MNPLKVKLKPDIILSVTLLFLIDLISLPIPKMYILSSQSYFCKYQVFVVNAAFRDLQLIKSVLNVIQF